MEALLKPVDETAGLFATPENTGFPFQRTYKPLSQQRKEIRLVEVLPGGLDDKLSLNLLHGCYLTETAHTVYESLSYCVGDVTKYRKIVFEGHEFDVFESLYNALSQLRPKANAVGRIFWIDQLCIHQHDLQEKSWQIELMKNIYEESCTVLSWLGPSSIVPDSCLAFEFVDEFWQLYGENILNASRALLPNFSSSKEIFSRFLGGFKNDGALTHTDSTLLDTTVNTEDIENLILRCGNLSALENLSSFAQKIDSLCELLRRPYWTRKWILQEVSAAKDGLVLCGESSMNTLVFFVTYALLVFRVEMDIRRGKSFEGDVDWYVEKLFRIQSCRQMHDFLNFWVVIQISNYYSLIDFLYLTRNISATDPRDGVYALLSTADPMEVDRLAILPDYSKESSVSTLISDICGKYVSSDRSSRGYSLDFANGILSSHNIPSWCFDFTIEASKQPGQGSMRSAIIKQGFRNASLVQDCGNSLLTIEGVFLGVVQETSTIAYPDNASQDTNWSELTERNFLEKEVHLLLDWMLSSVDLSNLAPIELRDALSQLLELLMENIGQLKSMADGLDELCELSDVDDVSLHLPYLAGLLLSLFIQADGHYYQWQLACLRLDYQSPQFVYQEGFPADVEDFNANIATLATDRSSKEEEAPPLTTSDLESYDIEERLCNTDQQHGMQTSRDLEGRRMQLESEGQICGEILTQSSIGKCKEDSVYAPGEVKQLGTDEPVSLDGGAERNAPACTLGVVQVAAQAGDQVFIEASGATTIILRPQGHRKNGYAVYKLVGKGESSERLGDQSSRENLLKIRKTVKVAIA